VQWYALLLCIPKVLDANADLETGYPDRYNFTQSLQESIRIESYLSKFLSLCSSAVQFSILL
jgi:hypothetical protein